MLRKGPHHRFGVVCPAVGRVVLQVVQATFDHPVLREVGRIKAQHSVVSHRRRGVGAQSQRAGEHVAPVVVDMFSDQVHAARRKKYTGRTRLGADLRKLGLNLFNGLLFCHFPLRSAAVSGSRSLIIFIHCNLYYTHFSGILNFQDHFADAQRAL